MSPRQTLLRVQSVSGVQPGRAVLHVLRHRGVAHQRGREAVRRAAGARRAQRHGGQRPGRAPGLRECPPPPDPQAHTALCGDSLSLSGRQGGLPALQAEVGFGRARLLRAGPAGRGGSEEAGLLLQEVPRAPEGRQ